MKLNKEEFMQLVREEALKIKEEILSEQIENVGDPMDVDMNKNDGTEDSDKALTYKDRSKKVEKKGPNPEEGGDYEDASDVDMNAQDDDQGHDEEIAAAVEVEAGSKKGGKGHTAGQHDGKFTSKKENPKKAASAPFDDKSFDGKMNSEDKLVDEDAKTFVDAGAEKGGSSHTAGQANAKVHERAPKVQDKAPIASAIEINGSNIKENYTKSELISFIKEEAGKLVEAYEIAEKNESKKETLEEELKKVQEELDSIK